MMRIVVPFFLVAKMVVASRLPIIPSSGCGNDFKGQLGQLVQENIFVDDNFFSSVERSYTLFVPQNYSTGDPLPLMFYFHGQFGDAFSDASTSGYKNFPMVQLYPQGISENEGSCGTGWELGPSGHDKDTCTSRAYSSSCCYDSCKKIGLCTGDGKNAECGWSTCYDSAKFVRDLITKTTSELCIDLNSIFVTGCSNGGMLTHYLYSALPTTFRAVMPVYGLPLIGYNNITEANKGTSILHLHGRFDKTIPVAGGDAGGWIYESAADVLGAWAALHACAGEAIAVTTPYDGGATNLACSEWTGCQDGNRVMLCLYDGVHGSWPAQGEELTFWFFNQTRFLSP